MVMSKLGFCDRWVSLIMRCVRTMSYSVLINGVPSTPFSPERGLRQEDPLSPYLFLLCVEAFTALLGKTEFEGRIHGINVAGEALACHISSLPMTQFCLLEQPQKKRMK